MSFSNMLVADPTTSPYKIIGLTYINFSPSFYHKKKKERPSYHQTSNQTSANRIDFMLLLSYLITWAM